MRNTMAALLLTMLMAASASAAPWKFGVMADTQWIGTDDGYNPSSVSIDIIQQLNQQFINKGVVLVVQVGDLSDSGGTVNEDFRAIFAQPLYNAGIGFFPFRGNHESSKAGGTEDVRIYPQTKTGQMNVTPSDVFSLTNADASNQPFPAVAGSPFTIGANFLTPDPSVTSGNDWRGLTYSFDYNNVRFVFLDQFTPLNAANGANNNPFTNAIDQQQTWITGQLSDPQRPQHAFVMSHKGLITENHVDALFGSSPAADPTGRDAFINSLYSNGVRYYMCGHDHMHNRALVSVSTGAPTDGLSAKVQNIIAASDSSKFYIPANPSNDTKYNIATFGHSLESEIAQELNTVGYYIFTVDGPKVNVDYYSAVVNPVYSSGEYLLSAASGTASRFTPSMTFSKRESFGYSLNGKEFLVGQGAAYSTVTDTYAGTTARILSGTNGSTAKDPAGRAYTKTVDTGWTDRGSDTFSDVLSLWGMTDLGATKTDNFALSMSFDPSVKPADVSWTTWINQGNLVTLNTKDVNGDWVPAVNVNVGGKKKFVLGPWNKVYSLGTFGVDPNTNTVWAVINTTGSGQFAAVRISN
jgi:hypothetical protein